MPALTSLKPQLWNVQQGYIAREWRDLWDHLVWAALPGGQWRHDLISGGMGTLLTSTDWRGVSKHGLSLNSTDSTNGGAHFPFHDRLLTITNQFTVIAWAKPTTLVSYSRLLNIPYRSGASWTEPYNSIGFYREDVATTGSVNYGDSTPLSRIATSDSGFIQATDPLTMYAVTRQGTAALFYRNGFQHGAAKTFPANNNVDWVNKQPIHLLQRSKDSLAEGMVGLCPLALIFNRALTPAEIKRLYIYPYGMFILSYLLAILPPFYEQEGSRFRRDDGSETTATWLAAQDTDINIARQTAFRLRVNANVTRNPSSQGYKLQYRKVGVNGWRDVP